jgi:hypothetical protein
MKGGSCPFRRSHPSLLEGDASRASATAVLISVRCAFDGVGVSTSPTLLPLVVNTSSTQAFRTSACGVMLRRVACLLPQRSKTQERRATRNNLKSTCPLESTSNSISSANQRSSRKLRSHISLCDRKGCYTARGSTHALVCPSSFLVVGDRLAVCCVRSSCSCSSKTSPFVLNQSTVE